MKAIKFTLIFLLTCLFSIYSTAYATTEESPFAEMTNLMLQQMEEKITLTSEQKQSLRSAFINYLEARETLFAEANAGLRVIGFDDLLVLYQSYEEIEKSVLSETQLNILYGDAENPESLNKMGITTLSSTYSGETITTPQTIHLDYFDAIDGYVFNVNFGSDYKVSIDWEVELFSPLDQIQISYNNVEEQYSQTLKSIIHTSKGSVTAPNSGTVRVYVKTNNNPATNPMSSSGMKFVLKKSLIIDTLIPGNVQLGDKVSENESYGKRLYFGDPIENGEDPMFIARYNVGYDTSELRVNIGDDQMDKFVVGSELYYKSGFTPALTVLMNGLRVGINNNDPQYSLDVKGTSQTENLILKTEVGNIQLSPLSTYASFSTDRPYFYFSKPIRVNSGQIGSSNISNLQLQTNGTTRMVISNTTGNVGIGVAEPNYTLDVAGTAQATKLITNTISTVNNQNLQIQTNGNVGIGVIDPEHKLEVNGSIRTQEVVIEAANWADFVFADDYKLLPLQEVKAFIDENKHLPGIPSEATVKENGVGLGEMQTLFLQKIEELTLYIINQQQTIEKLNNKINELETKIK